MVISASILSIIPLAIETTIHWSKVEMIDLCVEHTPFGCPVEPDV